MLTASEAPS